MNIATMIFLAAISVATTLVAVLRIISWQTLIRYHGLADIGFTLALMFMFSGTVSGMVIAVIGGLFFSIILSIGKKFTKTKNLNQ